MPLSRGGSGKCCPGDSRRATLRDQARDKVDIDLPRRRFGKSFKIDEYFHAANKLVDSFEIAFDHQHLDDAYMIGKVFRSFCLEDLERVSEYHSSKYEKTRRNISEDIEFVEERLNLVSRWIDEEESEMVERVTEKKIRSQLDRKKCAKDVSSTREKHQIAFSSKNVDEEDLLGPWSNHDRLDVADRRRLLSHCSGEGRAHSFRINTKKKSTLDRHSSHELGHDDRRPDLIFLNNQRKSVPEKSARMNPSEKAPDSRRNPSDMQVHDKRTSLDRGRYSSHNIESDPKEGIHHYSQNKERSAGIRRKKSVQCNDEEHDELGHHKCLQARSHYEQHEQSDSAARRQTTKQNSKTSRNLKKTDVRDDKSRSSQGTWVGKNLRIKQRTSKNNGGEIDQYSGTTLSDNEIEHQSNGRYLSEEGKVGNALVPFIDSKGPSPGISPPVCADDCSTSIASHLSFPSID